MSRKLALLLGLSLILGVARGEEPKTLRAAVSWSGDDSKVAKRGCERILTQKDFDATWAGHAKGCVPRIDFDRFMVLAVFDGDRINVDAETLGVIEQTGPDLRVQLVQITHQSMGEGSKATPYGIFVIPRAEGVLVVEEDQQDRIGKPSIWKERARFEKVGR